MPDYLYDTWTCTSNAGRSLPYDVDILKPVQVPVNSIGHIGLEPVEPILDILEVSFSHLDQKFFQSSRDEYCRAP